MEISYLDDMLENIRRIAETYNDMVTQYNSGKDPEDRTVYANVVMSTVRDKDSEIPVSAVSAIAFDLESERERMENEGYVSPFVPAHSKINKLKASAMQIIDYCNYVTALANGANGTDNSYAIFAELTN